LGIDLAIDGWDQSWYWQNPVVKKIIVYLKSVIEANKVTMLHFVPSMLGVFLPDLRAGECPSLDKVLCSGEALQPIHAEAFR
jgi:hypothetical protein